MVKNGAILRSLVFDNSLFLISVPITRDPQSRRYSPQILCLEILIKVIIKPFLSRYCDVSKHRGFSLRSFLLGFVFKVRGRSLENSIEIYNRNTFSLDGSIAATQGAIPHEQCGPVVALRKNGYCTTYAGSFNNMGIEDYLYVVDHFKTYRQYFRTAGQSSRHDKEPNREQGARRGQGARMRARSQDGSKKSQERAKQRQWEQGRQNGNQAKNSPAKCSR